MREIWRTTTWNGVFQDADLGVAGSASHVDDLSVVISTIADHATIDAPFFAALRDAASFADKHHKARIAADDDVSLCALINEATGRVTGLEPGQVLIVPCRAGRPDLFIVVTIGRRSQRAFDLTLTNVSRDATLNAYHPGSASGTGRLLRQSSLTFQDVDIAHLTDGAWWWALLCMPDENARAWALLYDGVIPNALGVHTFAACRDRIVSAPMRCLPRSDRTNAVRVVQHALQSALQRYRGVSYADARAVWTRLQTALLSEARDDLLARHPELTRADRDALRAGCDRVADRVLTNAIAPYEAFPFAEAAYDNTGDGIRARRVSAPAPADALGAALSSLPVSLVALRGMTCRTVPDLVALLDEYWTVSMAMPALTTLSASVYVALVRHLAVVQLADGMRAWPDTVPFVSREHLAARLVALAQRYTCAYAALPVREPGSVHGDEHVITLAVFTVAIMRIVDRRDDVRLVVPPVGDLRARHDECRSAWRLARSALHAPAATVTLEWRYAPDWTLSVDGLTTSFLSDDGLTAIGTVAMLLTHAVLCARTHAPTPYTGAWKHGKVQWQWGDDDDDDGPTAADWSPILGVAPRALNAPIDADPFSVTSLLLTCRDGACDPPESVRTAIVDALTVAREVDDDERDLLRHAGELCVEVRARHRHPSTDVAVWIADVYHVCQVPLDGDLIALLNQRYRAAVDAGDVDAALRLARALVCQDGVNAGARELHAAPGALIMAAGQPEFIIDAVGHLLDRCPDLAHRPSAWCDAFLDGVVHASLCEDAAAHALVKRQRASAALTTPNAALWAGQRTTYTRRGAVPISVDTTLSLVWGHQAYLHPLPAWIAAHPDIALVIPEADPPPAIWVHRSPTSGRMRLLHSNVQIEETEAAGRADRDDEFAVDALSADTGWVGTVLDSIMSVELGGGWRHELGQHVRLRAHAIADGASRYALLLMTWHRTGQTANVIVERDPPVMRVLQRRASGPYVVRTALWKSGSTTSDLSWIRRGPSLPDAVLDDIRVTRVMSDGHQQVLCPARFLRGVVPDPIVDQMTFWRVELDVTDDVLVGKLVGYPHRTARDMPGAQIVLYPTRSVTSAPSPVVVAHVQMVPVEDDVEEAISVLDDNGRYARRRVLQANRKLGTLNDDHMQRGVWRAVSLDQSCPILTRASLGARFASLVGHDSDNVLTWLSNTAGTARHFQTSMVPAWSPTSSQRFPLHRLDVGSVVLDSDEGRLLSRHHRATIGVVADDGDDDVDVRLGLAPHLVLADNRCCRYLALPGPVTIPMHISLRFAMPHGNRQRLALADAFVAQRDYVAALQQIAFVRPHDQAVPPPLQAINADGSPMGTAMRLHCLAIGNPAIDALVYGSLPSHVERYVECVKRVPTDIRLEIDTERPLLQRVARDSWLARCRLASLSALESGQGTFTVEAPVPQEEAAVNACPDSIPALVASASGDDVIYARVVEDNVCRGASARRLCRSVWDAVLKQGPARSSAQSFFQMYDLLSGSASVEVAPGQTSSGRTFALLCAPMLLGGPHSFALALLRSVTRACANLAPMLPALASSPSSSAHDAVEFLSRNCVPVDLPDSARDDPVAPARTVTVAEGARPGARPATMEDPPGKHDVSSWAADDVAQLVREPLSRVRDDVLVTRQAQSIELLAQISIQHMAEQDALMGDITYDDDDDDGDASRTASPSGPKESPLDALKRLSGTLRAGRRADLERAALHWQRWRSSSSSNDAGDLVRHYLFVLRAHRQGEALGVVTAGIGRVTPGLMQSDLQAALRAALDAFDELLALCASSSRAAWFPGDARAIDIGLLRAEFMTTRPIDGALLTNSPATTSLQLVASQAVLSRPALRVLVVPVGSERVARPGLVNAVVLTDDDTAFPERFAIVVCSGRTLLRLRGAKIDDVCVEDVDRVVLDTARCTVPGPAPSWTPGDPRRVPLALHVVSSLASWQHADDTAWMEKLHYNRPEFLRSLAAVHTQLDRGARRCALWHQSGKRAAVILALPSWYADELRAVLADWIVVYFNAFAPDCALGRVRMALADPRRPDDCPALVADAHAWIYDALPRLMQMMHGRDYALGQDGWTPAEPAQWKFREAHIAFGTAIFAAHEIAGDRPTHSDMHERLLSHILPLAGMHCTSPAPVADQLFRTSGTVIERARLAPSAATKSLLAAIRTVDLRLNKPGAVVNSLARSGSHVIIDLAGHLDEQQSDLGAHSGKAFPAGIVHEASDGHLKRWVPSIGADAHHDTPDRVGAVLVDRRLARAVPALQYALSLIDTPKTATVVIVTVSHDSRLADLERALATVAPAPAVAVHVVVPVDLMQHIALYIAQSADSDFRITKDHLVQWLMRPTDRNLSAPALTNAPSAYPTWQCLHTPAPVPKYAPGTPLDPALYKDVSQFAYALQDIRFVGVAPPWPASRVHISKRVLPALNVDVSMSIPAIDAVVELASHDFVAIAADEISVVARAHPDCIVRHTATGHVMRGDRGADGAFESLVVKVIDGRCMSTLTPSDVVRLTTGCDVTEFLDAVERVRLNRWTIPPWRQTALGQSLHRMSTYDAAKLRLQYAVEAAGPSAEEVRGTPQKLTPVEAAVLLGARCGWRATPSDVDTFLSVFKGDVVASTLLEPLYVVGDAARAALASFLVRRERREALRKVTARVQERQARMAEEERQRMESLRRSQRMVGELRAAEQSARQHLVECRLREEREAWQEWVASHRVTVSPSQPTPFSPERVPPRHHEPMMTSARWRTVLTTVARADALERAQEVVRLETRAMMAEWVEGQRHWIRTAMSDLDAFERSAQRASSLTASANWSAEDRQAVNQETTLGHPAVYEGVSGTSPRPPATLPGIVEHGNSLIKLSKASQVRVDVVERQGRRRDLVRQMMMLVNDKSPHTSTVLGALTQTDLSMMSDAEIRALAKIVQDEAGLMAEEQRLMENDDELLLKLQRYEQEMKSIVETRDRLHVYMTHFDDAKRSVMRSMSGEGSAGADKDGGQTTTTEHLSGIMSLSRFSKTEQHHVDDDEYKAMEDAIQQHPIDIFKQMGQDPCPVNPIARPGAAHEDATKADPAAVQWPFPVVLPRHRRKRAAHRRRHKPPA
ncbi:unnamed protein product (mitochondrion) [Plasmodiophora brassicae]|uniref:Uncharacterized protein n=1 Tax=Plasmodiophora brassicae TaxID=37360 RepID=A0A3P3YJ14_PLABS|nr:unnamed protein product [Plasmodiophora brassicae]